MRILHIISDFVPTYRPDVAALFGRYLPRLGINADLVARAAPDAIDPRGDWEGGRVFACRQTGVRSRDQLMAFFHDIKMLWAVQPEQYDAIQIRDKAFAAVFAIWVARRRGLPLFYWMSFPMSEVYIEIARAGGLSIGLTRWLFLMSKGLVGRELIYRYVLPRCTHVFVQSDRMREDLAALGVPRGRMTPVPMGVDLERAFPTRANALSKVGLRGHRIVAYLGSFEQFRRIEFLFEIVQQLAVTVPDITLLMIGDGPGPSDRSRLEVEAKRTGIADRVVWTGWVSPTDAWRWLVSADVAVSLLPRGILYDRASPTKIVEYLALGVPVVANDQPDQKHVLEESGAGICCEMNLPAAVSAIEQILTNPGLADRMRAAGPRYIMAERGYDRIAARVAATYRRYTGVTD